MIFINLKRFLIDFTAIKHAFLIRVQKPTLLCICKKLNSCTIMIIRCKNNIK